MENSSEIVADAISLPIFLKFQHTPKIRFPNLGANNVAEPRKPINVVLETPDIHSDSCVCMSILDYSMILLNEDHPLTTERIKNELYSAFKNLKIRKCLKIWYFFCKYIFCKILYFQPVFEFFILF